MGFIELALAFKFLSNADLVLQLGLVTREVFITIWISIFALLTFYLAGFVRMKSDSEIKHLSVGRLMLTLVSFAFTMYLIPGLWGAPLNLISGFPPPDFYKEWKVSGLEMKMENNVSNNHAQGCPNGLNCFHDFEEGILEAKKSNKLVLLDFTGWACVNCRKMESLVWKDPEIDRLLREKFVVVSLFVDDQRNLPDDGVKIETMGGKEYSISTFGSKWSFLQARRYKTSTQPYYVVMNSEEKDLAIFSGYDPDKTRFAKFLNEGLNEN